MTADERKALSFVALLLGFSVVARAVNRPEAVVISGATTVDIQTRLQQNRQVRGRPATPSRTTTTPPPAPPVPRWRRAAPPVVVDYRTEQKPEPLDLNRATAEELDRLPGVSPTVAQRIADFRKERGFFQTFEQLDSVKGIGPALMAKLKPLVIVR